MESKRAVGNESYTTTIWEQTAMDMSEYGNEETERKEEGKKQRGYGSNKKLHFTIPGCLGPATHCRCHLVFMPA